MAKWSPPSQASLLVAVMGLSCVVAGPTVLAASSDSSQTRLLSRSESPSEPPAALDALSLVHSAGLAANLGAPVTATQDDGGETFSGGGPTQFQSVVEVATKTTVLTVTLLTFPSGAAAKQTYHSDVDQGWQSVSGVGDEAAVLPDFKLGSECNFSPAASPNDQEECLTLLRSAGTALLSGVGHEDVLKGAQVVEVLPAATAAASSQLTTALATSSTTAAWPTVVSLLNDVFFTLPQAAAKELAAKMTGQLATKNYLAVPKEGLNACGVPASKLVGSHGSATAANIPSDTPPEQECLYTINDESYDFYVETSEQASGSISGESLAQVYAKDAEGASLTKASHVSKQITIKAFGDGGDLFSSEDLITINSSNGDPSLLLRVEPTAAASYGQRINRDDCDRIIAALPKDYIDTNTPEAPVGNWQPEKYSWREQYDKIMGNTTQDLVRYFCITLALHPLAN